MEVRMNTEVTLKEAMETITKMEEQEKKMKEQLEQVHTEFGQKVDSGHDNLK